HFGFGLQPEPSGPDTGPPEAGGTTAGPGWNWTMPSGLTYRDAPNPPLDP
ncbi:MAG: hypothetical protein QG671_4239, partial [Actinomycetota bacterium]|nr:hypothetical protein [Actinomycetota bacterium]